MEIEIRGRSDKANLDQLRNAAEWYAQRLMGPRLSPNIFLLIRFRKNLLNRRNIWAECSPLERGANPRSFEINLDAHAGNRTTLITLAHEMVHVKQFARRELVEIKKDTVFKWYGERYEDDVVYWEQPWEIEAHGREIGLYVMWRESLYQRVDTTDHNYDD